MISSLTSSVWTLSVVASILVIGGNGKQLPDIYWDSRNPMFDAGNNLGSSLALQAHIRDRLNIHCPQYSPLSQPDQIEYSKIYMVSKKGYESCSLSGGHLVAECLTPLEQSFVTLVFREYTPNPGALEFTPGETYYFITTSDGTVGGIDLKRGGMCSRYNLRLKIHIRSKLSWSRSKMNNGFITNPSTNSFPAAPKSPEISNFISALDLAKKVQSDGPSPATSLVQNPRHFSSLNKRNDAPNRHLQETLVIYEYDPKLRAVVEESGSAGVRTEQGWREGEDYIVEYSSFSPMRSAGTCYTGHYWLPIGLIIAAIFMSRSGPWNA